MALRWREMHRTGRPDKMGMSLKILLDKQLYNHFGNVANDEIIKRVAVGVVCFIEF